MVSDRDHGKEGLNKLCRILEEDFNAFGCSGHSVVKDFAFLARFSVRVSSL